MKFINPGHVHLLFTHLPVLGTAIGTLLLLLASVAKGDDFKKLGSGVFVMSALAAIPTYLNGEPPEELVEHLHGVSKPIIEQHEKAAKLVLASEPVGEHVGESHEHGGETMTFTIPHPLKVEHEELHATLAQATKAGGKIGEAAKAVAKLLHAHFVKEEEYALPPLGLLSPLAAGEVTPEMGGVLAMTDRLKRELPEMLAEHKAIVAALEQLAGTARQTGNSKYVHFAEQLKLHAQTEEDVLYPAAILIGEYLKLKLGK